MTDIRRKPTPPGWTTKPPPNSLGEALWRLTRDGHSTVCELRDLSRSGDGVEVRVVVDGEASVSQLFVDEPRARVAAGVLKQDHLDAGWREPTV